MCTQFFLTFLGCGHTLSREHFCTQVGDKLLHAPALCPDYSGDSKSTANCCGWNGTLNYCRRSPEGVAIMAWCLQIQSIDYNLNTITEQTHHLQHYPPLQTFVHGARSMGVPRQQIVTSDIFRHTMASVCLLKSKEAILQQDRHLYSRFIVHACAHFATQHERMQATGMPYKPYIPPYLQIPAPTAMRFELAMRGHRFLEATPVKNAQHASKDNTPSTNTTDPRLYNRQRPTAGSATTSVPRSSQPVNKALAPPAQSNPLSTSKAVWWKDGRRIARPTRRTQKSASSPQHSTAGSDQSSPAASVTVRRSARVRDKEQVVNYAEGDSNPSSAFHSPEHSPQRSPPRAEPNSLPGSAQKLGAGGLVSDRQSRFPSSVKRKSSALDSSSSAGLDVSQQTSGSRQDGLDEGSEAIVSAYGTSPAAGFPRPGPSPQRLRSAGQVGDRPAKPSQVRPTRAAAQRAASSSHSSGLKTLAHEKSHGAQDQAGKMAAKELYEQGREHHQKSIVAARNAFSKVQSSGLSDRDPHSSTPQRSLISGIPRDSNLSSSVAYSDSPRTQRLIDDLLQYAREDNSAADPSLTTAPGPNTYDNGPDISTNNTARPSPQPTTTPYGQATATPASLSNNTFISPAWLSTPQFLPPSATTTDGLSRTTSDPRKRALPAPDQLDIVGSGRNKRTRFDRSFGQDEHVYDASAFTASPFARAPMLAPTAVMWVPPMPTPEVHNADDSATSGAEPCGEHIDLPDTAAAAIATDPGIGLETQTELELELPTAASLLTSDEDGATMLAAIVDAVDGGDETQQQAEGEEEDMVALEFAESDQWLNDDEAW